MSEEEKVRSANFKHFGKATGGQVGYRTSTDGYRTATGTYRDGELVWSPGDPPVETSDLSR